MAWLIDEDRALKEKLSGYSVSNYSDGRPIKVPVYFRFPDSEERTRTFPHIAIDLVDIVFAADRAHRADGYIQSIDMEQATPLTGYTLVANDMPLPWSLEYQLAAYSRQPWHDRELSAYLYMMFPEQFGQLDMTNYDNTVRRADLQSVIRRDTVDSSNKRLYRNIFSIAVSSEFYLDQVQQIKNVISTNLELISYINESVVPVG